MSGAGAMGIGCCTPAPEHKMLCGCTVATLVISILSMFATLFAAVTFWFRAPVGAMGITMMVGALILSFASCGSLCCTKPNTGRMMMLVTSVVALVLAVIGIALIGMPSQVCASQTCYSMDCQPCKGYDNDDSSCNPKIDGKNLWDGATGKDGQSVICSYAPNLLFSTQCEGDYYGAMYDTAVWEDSEKYDAEKDEDKDTMFWGFKDKEECKEWAYDEYPVAGLGWLLVFIGFPVLFLTACITAGVAFKAPLVEDKPSVPEQNA